MGKIYYFLVSRKKETFIGCAEKREIRQENRKLVMDVASKGKFLGENRFVLTLLI